MLITDCEMLHIPGYQINLMRTKGRTALTRVPQGPIRQGPFVPANRSRDLSQPNAFRGASRGWSWASGRTGSAATFEAPPSCLMAWHRPQPATPEVELTCLLLGRYRSCTGGWQGGFRPDETMQARLFGQLIRQVNFRLPERRRIDKEAGHDSRTGWKLRGKLGPVRRR